MRRAILLAIFTLTAAPAQPQPAALPPVSTEKLADGVYAVIHNPAAGVEGNTLVVVNDDDVLVVDANASAASARRTIVEIRKLTPKPVRYVVNTHWHDDHVYGNEAYDAEYPGVRFVAHPLTRQDIVGNTFGNNPWVLDVIEADVRRLEGYLQSGVYRDGKKVEGELETRIRNYLAARRGDLEARTGARAVIPSVEVADVMTLKRGTREIQIRFLGRGNTRGDLVVYLPNERVLATGDLVVHPVPFATNVYGQEWVATLDRMMQLPAAIVLPGHGPVMRDWTFVRRLRDAVDKHVEAVKRAKAEGRTLAETQQQVQLPEVRDSFVEGIDLRRTGYESFFRPMLLRNLWEELDPAIMKAYAAASLNEAAPGVYTFGPRGDTPGVTVFVNQKDMVIGTSLTDAAAAHATVRALRELTARPVRQVVALGDPSAQAAALDVFRDAYQQAEVAAAAPAPAGKSTMVVTTPVSIRSGEREFRLVSREGRLILEVPTDRLRVSRGGRVESAR